jgi:hypothetical protein
VPRKRHQLSLIQNRRFIKDRFSWSEYLPLRSADPMRVVQRGQWRGLGPSGRLPRGASTSWATNV